MYGKIISAEEANKLFGDVIESIKINAKELLSLIGSTDKSVMLNIINGELYILGDARKVLRPATKEVKPEIVFHHYSKEIVLELINSNTDGILSVEKRKETLTITNGANTLEFCVYCPPICF
jgi:hypothetical protein